MSKSFIVPIVFGVLFVLCGAGIATDIAVNGALMDTARTLTALLIAVAAGTAGGAALVFSAIVFREDREAEQRYQALRREREDAEFDRLLQPIW